jgi:hypothetical protein
VGFVADDVGECRQCSAEQTPLFQSQGADTESNVWKEEMIVVVAVTMREAEVPRRVDLEVRYTVMCLGVGAFVLDRSSSRLVSSCSLCSLCCPFMLLFLILWELGLEDGYLAASLLR